MGFSITSAVLGAINIIIYSISISVNSVDSDYNYENSGHSGYEGELAISGIILFLGSLELLMGICAAICCCLMKVCSCCYNNQSQQGHMMQSAMTHGHHGPVAVPMQTPGGLVAVETDSQVPGGLVAVRTDSQVPQGDQPQMLMVPAFGDMGGQPQLMQVPPASGAMPTVPVSQRVEMTESAGHGKYMTLNNEQDV